MKVKLPKIFRQNVKKFAIMYYNAHHKHFVDNPYYERCFKTEGRTAKTTWKTCRNCEWDEECGKGERFWVDNPNIIAELCDEIVTLTEGKVNIIYG